MHNNSSNQSANARAFIDECMEPGQVGALLRQEGPYLSNLTTWDRQRDEGQLQWLSPEKQRPKAKAVDPLAQRLAELERETQQIRDKLKVQRGVDAMLICQWSQLVKVTKETMCHSPSGESVWSLAFQSINR
jgi:hypothetical protein